MGGQGVQKNHKNIGVLNFLSNIGPDPLKNHKAAKPALNVGPSTARQRNAYQRQASDGGPMMASRYSGIWFFSPSQKKKLSKLEIKLNPL